MVRPTAKTVKISTDTQRMKCLFNGRHISKVNKLSLLIISGSNDKTDLSPPRLLTLERDVTKQRERLAETREETQQLAERHEDLTAVVDNLEGCCQAKQKVRQHRSKQKIGPDKTENKTTIRPSARTPSRR